LLDLSAYSLESAYAMSALLAEAYPSQALEVARAVAESRKECAAKHLGSPGSGTGSAGGRLAAVVWAD
jgi:hypothetical protein